MTQQESINDAVRHDDAIAFLSTSLASLQTQVRILIVEDDPNDILFLRTMLAKYPCRVDVLSKVREFPAFIHSNAHKINLVFLDVKLNGGSGFELMRLAKQSNLILNFIVLTGDKNPSIEEQAMSLGAIAVFVKPPTVQELESVLGKLVK